MQYCTSLLLFFYSLSGVFSTSFIVQDVILVLFLLMDQGIILSQCFNPVRAFVWRRHPLANRFRAEAHPGPQEGRATEELLEYKRSGERSRQGIKEQ